MTATWNQLDTQHYHNTVAMSLNFILREKGDRQPHIGLTVRRRGYGAEAGNMVFPVVELLLNFQNLV
jgi:hypothetical protein